MYYEVRWDFAADGRLSDLVRCMDETVVPLHVEMGVEVVATFVDHAGGAYVWLRRFAGDVEKEEALSRVHGDGRWQTDVLPSLRPLLSSQPATTVRLEPTPRSPLATDSC
jgi:hypothetical protein